MLADAQCQILSTLPTETETEVMAILANLSDLESRIEDMPKHLKATQVGNIKLQ